MLAGALLFVLAIGAPGPALALTAVDVAGTIDGKSVTVAEVDRAAGGPAARTWREIHAIMRSAARGVCIDRIETMLASAEGVDPITWRARIWQQSAPTEAQAEAYVHQHPELYPGGNADLSAVAHRIRVESYRARSLAAAERSLTHDFLLFLVPLENPPAGEPAIPEVVGRCLGRPITGEDVERYAAYPLYRRRAGLVSELCRQFDVDYSRPLVLERAAAAAGKSTAALLAEVEGDLGELSRRDVEREAIDRFGRVDEVTLAKARLALDSVRRNDRRMAFLERIRREMHAECLLPMPKTPSAEVRTEGIATGPSEGLRVSYFGNFTCPSCPAGWEILTQLQSKYGRELRVAFHHHFPESDFRPFAIALEAHCTARQGRFFEYGSWRTSTDGSGSAVDALGLDADGFARCAANPTTAVEILDDTAEALRLGFRDAVPSWVVGERPRRGFQGQGRIETAVEQQLAARREASDAPNEEQTND
jgi:hypothetical protein